MKTRHDVMYEDGATVGHHEPSDGPAQLSFYISDRQLLIYYINTVVKYYFEY